LVNPVFALRKLWIVRDYLAKGAILSIWQEGLSNRRFPLFKKSPQTLLIDV
jgi:hypothetical protein